MLVNLDLRFTSSRRTWVAQQEGGWGGGGCLPCVCLVRWALPACLPGRAPAALIAWARAPGRALGPAMPVVLGAALGSAVLRVLGGQCTPFLGRLRRTTLLVRRQCTTLLVRVKPLLGHRLPICSGKRPR